MFDLEKAIADWRKHMLAAGVKSPVPLDELESHLREDIDYQVGSGLSPGQAFEAAAQQMGAGTALGTEFKKVQRTFMKKIMIILLGLLGILLGPGLILPALAKYRDFGVWNSDVIMPMVWGTLILLAGVVTAAFGFKRRSA